MGADIGGGASHKIERGAVTRRGCTLTHGLPLARWQAVKGAVVLKHEVAMALAEGQLTYLHVQIDAVLYSPVVGEGTPIIQAIPQ
ncbi:hypothetical protein IYQ_14717 [Aeromonas salmonicida subsp. salmonicida 01-B526]|uniref:Uncharacterized protein n=1 Tax=Aeromonas salmonicida subsp. salmonicida 01-B526 TaxID=1076135 RepID=A0ABN0DY75_AERSS|nr:hypothetical protein IYQ_14717 [Aeromonas salmonicida subsp. salmonicida 01-B526]